MRVVFDHQIFVVQRYGGFSRYFVSLSRALRHGFQVDARIIAPAYVNQYLEDEDLRGPSFRMRQPLRGLKYRVLLGAPVFRVAAAAGAPDIVHETHFMLSDGRHLPRSVATVATCHDMIIERYADGSASNRDAIERKRRALERADGVICISENTRKDLLERYPHLEPRTAVVHHGVDQTVATGAPLDVPGPYILFVGARGGYKNFGNTLRAIGASGLLRDGFHLLCFGGGALGEAELRQCADAGLRPDRVLQREGDDAALGRAYRDAAALVFPSAYEGFGMPLTEAMVQGCPVVCSRASCFPEICGDAAEYFDPASPDDIRAALERVLGDEALRARMRDAGRARAQHFTWERCAQQSLALYGRALGRAN